MNFAIVGCGSIGAKRARTLAGHRLRFAVDTAIERARALSPVEAVEDWSAAVASSEVDAVIVATTNRWLAPVTEAAVRAGKHVLVEKPAARTAAELDLAIAAARASGVVVQVGFNHRYHPAMRKARELIDRGALGELLFVRGRYGHGGRAGYEKEWRADPEISGGGELIDQGVHLIDLARWLLGEFTSFAGRAMTYFWKMPVDDNAFLALTTAAGRMAWLHVSCTEWKNLFSLEIYGRSGKLDIQGLGGSYGVERIAYYRMLPQMGPPETTIWEYPGEDRSWDAELRDFEESIRTGRKCGPGLDDARAALQIVERVYESSR